LRLAFRILGSLSDAEDIVQEAWLRLARFEAKGPGMDDSSPISDVQAWLTTVTARLALDRLRARRRRAEEPFETDGNAAPHGPKPGYRATPPPTPEDEAILAEEVGLAFLVVMNRLGPAERLAFVLHDGFGMSFDEVALVLGRTPEAARQVASRARRRVRGEPLTPALKADREVVSAFARAARAGDMVALVRLLDPEVTLRIDPTDLPGGAPAEVRGAQIVASRAVVGALGRSGQFVLADGRPALAVASGSQLDLVMTFDMHEGRIARIGIVAVRARLNALALVFPATTDAALG
jgi:RNA polymerase sigma-70 factor (ECF subfamily)